MGNTYDKYTGVLVLAASLVLILAGTILSTDWELVEVNPNLNTVTADIFIKYLFIIVAAERAVSVYISIQFEGKKKQLENAVQAWNDKIAKAKILLGKKDDIEADFGDDADPDFVARKSASPDEKVSVRLVNLRENAQNRLAEQDQQSTRVALTILLVVGLLLAISGLSIMQDLIITPDAWGDDQYTTQRMLFRFLDILITGALIGGGSKSFHQLLTTLNAVLEKVKNPKPADTPTP